MPYEIRTSSLFEKELKRLAKKFPSMRNDFRDFLNSLQNDPTQGIALGRDCYKIRFKISSKNKGKSGGARVITCVKIVQGCIYLLSIYDKSEKENIDDEDLNDVLRALGLIA